MKIVNESERKKNSPCAGNVSLKVNESSRKATRSDVLWKITPCNIKVIKLLFVPWTIILQF